MDVLKFATVAISRQEVSKRRRQACLEAQLNHIFKDFELILREGLDLMDPSGQAHVVFAYPAIVLADNMDIWGITRVLGGDCAACRRCKGSLLDTAPAPLRTTQTEQPLVQRVFDAEARVKASASATRGDAKEELAEALKVLKQAGMHAETNVLWQLAPFTDGYQGLGWPLLHNAPKGFIEKQMLLVIQRAFKQLGVEREEEDDEDDGDEAGEEEEDDKGHSEGEGEGEGDDDEAMDEAGSGEEGAEAMDEDSSEDDAREARREKLQAQRQWNELLTRLDRWVRRWPGAYPCIRGRFRHNGMSTLFGRHDGKPTFSKCTALDMTYLFRFFRLLAVGLLEDQDVDSSLSMLHHFMVMVTSSSRTQSQLAQMRTQAVKVISHS